MNTSNLHTIIIVSRAIAWVGLLTCLTFLIVRFMYVYGITFVSPF